VLPHQCGAYRFRPIELAALTELICLFELSARFGRAMRLRS